MKITELIAELKKIQAEHGNIEVTCTGCLAEDGDASKGRPFETTVETLIVHEHPSIGPAVRLFL